MSQLQEDFQNKHQGRDNKYNGKKKGVEFDPKMTHSSVKITNSLLGRGLKIGDSLTDSLVVTQNGTDINYPQFNHLRMSSFEPSFQQDELEDMNTSDNQCEPQSGGWTPRTNRLVPYNNQIHSKFRQKSQKNNSIKRRYLTKQQSTIGVNDKQKLIREPGKINIDLLMKYRNINRGPEVLVGSKVQIEQQKLPKQNFYCELDLQKGFKQKNNHGRHYFSNLAVSKGGSQDCGICSDQSILNNIKELQNDNDPIIHSNEQTLAQGVYSRQQTLMVKHLAKKVISHQAKNNPTQVSQQIQTPHTINEDISSNKEMGAGDQSYKDQQQDLDAKKLIDRCNGDLKRPETREMVLTTTKQGVMRHEVEVQPNCAKSNLSHDESMSSPDKISQIEMESRMAITSFRNNHPKERGEINHFMGIKAEINNPGSHPSSPHGNMHAQKRHQFSKINVVSIGQQPFLNGAIQNQQKLIQEHQSPINNLIHVQRKNLKTQGNARKKINDELIQPMKPLHLQQIHSRQMAEEATQFENNCLNLQSSSDSNKQLLIHKSNPALMPKILRFQFQKQDGDVQPGAAGCLNEGTLDTFSGIGSLNNHQMQPRNNLVLSTDINSGTTDSYHNPLQKVSEKQKYVRSSHLSSDSNRRDGYHPISCTNKTNNSFYFPAAAGHRTKQGSPQKLQKSPKQKQDNQLENLNKFVCYDKTNQYGSSLSNRLSRIQFSDIATFQRYLQKTGTGHQKEQKQYKKGPERAERTKRRGWLSGGGICQSQLAQRWRDGQREVNGGVFREQTGGK